MNTILEISPASQTVYTMDDTTYEAVVRCMDLRIAKGVKRTLALLPPEMREAVAVKVVPKKQEKVQGFAANYLFVEDVR